MLVEDIATRLAIDTVIHHEVGHVRHGHYTPGNCSFAEYCANGGDAGKSSKRNWNLAAEMAADDVAARMMAMRVVNKQFWSFNMTEEFLAIGPFALLNALILGVFGYFAVVEMKSESRKAQSQQTADYPTIANRLRYFYMTLSDTLDEQGVVFDEAGLTLFSKLRIVTDALNTYLDDMDISSYVATGRPRIREELKEGIAWVESMEEEKKQLSEIDWLYNNFKDHEPLWKDYSFWGRPETNA